MIRDTQTLGFQILANTKALLGYWDKTMICRFANQAYEEWLGIKPEDIVNKATLKEFLGPVYDKHLPFIKNVLMGKTVVFERDFVLPAGGVRRAVVSYTPDIADNIVSGFYVHAADTSIPKENSGTRFFRDHDHGLETIKTLQLNLLSKFPGLEQLARNEGISLSKLKSEFRLRTGLTPFAYYRRLQMDFAYTYLNENRCSRKQMASLLNFANPSNFSVCYNAYLEEKKTNKVIESQGAATDQPDTKRTKVQRILEETSEAAGIGVWEYDSSTKHEFWSHTARTVLNLPPNSLLSLKILQSLCASTRDEKKIAGLMKHPRKERFPVTFSVGIQASQTSVKNILLTAICNQDGIISGLIREMDSGSIQQ